MTERVYRLEEEFLTNQDLVLENVNDDDKGDIEIPKGTLFTIVDIEDMYYVIYFEGYGDVEVDWHRVSGEEINEMSASAT